jgi:hypothetical protein
VDDHRHSSGLVEAIGFGPHAPSNLPRPVLENPLCSFRDAAVERAVSAGSSYRSNAEAMGIPYSDLIKKINLTDQIPKLQWLVDRYGIDYTHMTVAEWRRLSGYQHGKVLASMLGSDRTIMARVEGGSQTTSVRPD